MTTLAVAAVPGRRLAAPVRIVAELRRREPLLAGFGLLLLAAIGPALVAAGMDERQLGGVNVWTKPIKFLLSVAVFALTTAWFYGFLPAARRRARGNRVVVWTILATGLFEVAYITIQAARGEASHFNETTPFHAGMYALMGLAALTLTAMTLPLAREIARHGAALDPAVRLSIVLGLVLTFVLGASAGMAISAHGGAVIGGVPHGPGLPLLGWSTTGGDLRAVHFIGIHAQQLLPLAGLAAAGRAQGCAIVAAAAAAYALLALVVLVLALNGIPLPLMW